MQGEARILLSLLPVPASAEKIAEEWSAGVELMFANFGSGQTFPRHDVSISYFAHFKKYISFLLDHYGYSVN